MLCSRSLWKNTISRGVSPTVLYGSLWGTIWLIHLTEFLNYHSVSSQALVYSGLTMIALFFGEATALFMRFDPSRIKNHQLRPLDHQRLKICVIGCGVLSIAAGLFTFSSSLVIFGRFWSSDADIMKVYRTTVGIGMFAETPIGLLSKYSLLMQGFSYSGCILGSLYMKSVNPRYWFGVFMPILGVSLFDIGWGSRAHIYDVLLMYFSIQLLIPMGEGFRVRKSRIGVGTKKRIALGLLILLTTGTIMNLIGESTRREQKRNIGGISAPLSFLQFIDYNAGNLVSFDKTIDQNPSTWGRMSFGGIEQWLRLLRLIPPSIPYPSQMVEWEEEYVRIETSNWYLRSLNTYSWLRYLYSDFGVIGLLLIPYIIGFVAAKNARKTSLTGNYAFQATIIMVTCYVVLLRSPNIMLFRNENFVLGVIILSIGSWWIHRVRVNIPTSSI